MRLILSMLCFLFLVSDNIAQFEYEFTSSPDSATVFLNGEEECKTPCKVRFFWRDAIDGSISFEVKEPGFKPWYDTITSKPAQLNLEAFANLVREFHEFDLDSGSALVAYDKLVADFKEGRKIGTYTDVRGNIEELKWEGNIKVGSEKFESRFYEIISNVGFITPYSEEAKLFSGKGEGKTRIPRFIIGIQLIDYDVEFIKERESYYKTGNLAGRTSMKLEWQVLDKTMDKVVLRDTTEGVSKFRRRSYNKIPDNLPAFEDGFVKFLETGELYQLVNNSDELLPSKLDSAQASAKMIEIPSVGAEEFESQSEMIQYASEACVTVLTDGGHGSGVIIDSEGLVITAYHVIAGVNRIQVKFSSGLTLDADVIATDRDFDVALLDVSGSGFRALPMNLTGEVGLGQELITIGTPADIELGQSIAKGLLSGKRKIEDKIFMQLDLAVSPGNSGGPLLNKKGEIEGIVLRKIIGAGVEGIGFGVPIKDALNALNISVAEE